MLERTNSPHGMITEYFWFEGGFYRREGFRERKDYLWERYSDDVLSTENPWWRWSPVDKELQIELERCYQKTQGDIPVFQLNV